MAGLAELKQRYVSGGVPDSVVKARLEDCLQALLSPIREGRARFAEDRGQVMKLLRDGSFRAPEVAARTVDEVKRVMGVGLLA